MRFLIVLWLCFFLRFWHLKNHPKNHYSSLRKVWHQTNLLSLFEIHVKGFDKKNFKFFLSFLWIFLRLCSFLRFCHPQKNPKNHHNSLKKVWHQTNLLSLFKVKMFRFSTKLWFKLFLTFVNSFEVKFLFTILVPKNHHSFFKKCGIRLIYFHCLKYMLMVLTKLWFKFFCHSYEYFLGNVQFLRCFNPKKSPKNYYRLIKWV